MLKLLISSTASGQHGGIIMATDVKRAYFHTKSKRFVYAQLPPEDVLPGEEGLCGRLNYSMRGTRDAAANWAQEYFALSNLIGFKAGVASFCVFGTKGSDCAFMFTEMILWHLANPKT